jgi:hypothetical protein
MPCYWARHKVFSLKAQEAIRYMLDLQHLSFSAFWYDPKLKATEDPLNNSNHLLYMLPHSLISLRLAGRMSPAMATFNENALTDMFCNNRLPCLTTVDLNGYRARTKLGEEGLATRLAHPNSRVNRLVLPADKAPSSMILSITLEQGKYLRARGSKEPFTLVVFHKDPKERASRVDNIKELIQKYTIPNVQVQEYQVDAAEASEDV